MFIMDMPYVPAQETHIVLTQAAAPTATQPDYLLTGCQETESTGNPRSAFRSVDPAGLLEGYLGVRDHRPFSLENAASIKPILLESTTHGEITPRITNYGRSVFHYDPKPNYVGNDHAVFMAEFEGKAYKIVINLVVTLNVGESPLMEGEEPVCPEPTLIKVNGKPVSGSLDFGPGYSVDSLSVNFADFAGGAVGQTTGEGVNATITLDTNQKWFLGSDKYPTNRVW